MLVFDAVGVAVLLDGTGVGDAVGEDTGVPVPCTMIVLPSLGGFVLTAQTNTTTMAEVRSVPATKAMKDMRRFMALRYVHLA
ncbi:hypothetical protein Ssi02_71110 [Sinosporangium siamense]|uniref:Uncharacterized protein n=1 Tax=Sinosporangium siamense TaxID=1367973 RepID=A0A919RN76_9ACTN|nr:hypothetical protein Ssi02_71110 [Sinosporangium siamense]